MNTTSSYIEKKERVVQRKNPLAQLSPAKKTSFQHAVLEKSDVGEFQGGYFIMPGAVSDDRMKRPSPQQYQQHQQNRNSPQRKTRTNNNNNNNNTSSNQPEEIDLKTYKQQQQQQYNNLKNIHNNLKQQNNNNCSNNNNQSCLTDDFLLTPDSFNTKDLKLDNNITPSKKFNNQTYTKILSPQSTKYSSYQQQQQQQYANNNTSNSPPRSNSPNKKSLTSPQSTSCWAGGAFNNSPAPNALPIPNFDDEELSSSSFAPPQPPPHQPTVNLESMTFDLRRLLNITPIQVSDVSV